MLLKDVHRANAGQAEVAPMAANLQATHRQTAAVSNDLPSQSVAEMQYTGPAERAKQVQADFLECVELKSFEARFTLTNGGNGTTDLSR